MAAAVWAGPADAAPAEVKIGAYINDIQALDLRTHSYVIDIYVWFRWTDPEINPIATFEFMNPYDPESKDQSSYYNGEPLPQPDGSVYAITRYQGAFSTKFPVNAYPFDSQSLKIHIEDGESAADALRYLADDIVLNPDIRLPGYRLGEPRIEVETHPYTTNFGDLSQGEAAPYSRVTISIPIQRPWISGAIKTFLPIGLIILCAASALLLAPQHVEARVGLTITALLTLVAHQFTAAAGLPEVGYLLVLDQIYIVSYAYILLVVGLIVAGTRAFEARLARGEQPAVRQGGVLTAWAVILLYSVVIAATLAVNLWRGGALIGHTEAALTPGFTMLGLRYV